MEWEKELGGKGKHEREQTNLKGNKGKVEYQTDKSIRGNWGAGKAIGREAKTGRGQTNLEGNKGKVEHQSDKLLFKAVLRNTF